MRIRFEGLGGLSLRFNADEITGSRIKRSNRFWPSDRGFVSAAVRAFKKSTALHGSM